MRRLVRRLLGINEPAALPATAPAALLEHAREGAALLEDDGPARAAADRLRVGFVIPSFRRGSGGHATIANLVRALESRGHECALWLEDHEGRHAGQSAEAVNASFRDFFGPMAGRVHRDLSGWAGADVAVATGWQTVHRALRLSGTGGRAYLVQDHEPDFYGASAEQAWARATYRLGLHCIAASPWLAALLRDRYGASASSFDLGVDHDAYHPPARRYRGADRVIVYARAVTARRAVPLALLALAELHRRRPATRIALFGESRRVAAGFPCEQLGVLSAPELAREYGRSTVGVVLSMTNPSLVPTEMMSCALPVVELSSESIVATFGRDGPAVLAAFDPLAVAGAVERLLDDHGQREQRASAGVDLAAGRTWAAAGAQVDAGLREALHNRQRPPQEEGVRRCTA